MLPMAIAGAEYGAPLLMEKATPYLMNKLGPKFGALAKDIGGKTLSLILDNKKRKSAKNWVRSRTSRKGFHKLFTRDLGNISRYLGKGGYIAPETAQIGTSASNMLGQAVETLKSQSDLLNNIEPLPQDSHDTIMESANITPEEAPADIADNVPISEELEEQFN